MQGNGSCTFRVPDFLVVISGRERGFLPARPPHAINGGGIRYSPEGTTTPAREIGAQRALTPPTGPISVPVLGHLWLALWVCFLSRAEILMHVKSSESVVCTVVALQFLKGSGVEYIGMHFF